MLRSLRNIRRLIQIARILARNDALFPLEDFGVAPAIVFAAKLVSYRKAEGRPGQRLARALNEAGPSFIKLGQSLSTRSDLLGEELAEDLSQLQDSLPAFGGDQARKIIEAEFECPLSELYSSFDDQAIAAASIAQVHFATTIDGREVAVKVLRPDIEAAFARDMELLRWVARLVERTQPELRRLKPQATVETLAATVVLEMDLRFEAAAAAEIGDNFIDDPEFTVPEVDWSRTGKKVLTTRRLSGIPMDDLEAITKAGHNPVDILQKASNATFKQIFRDGFFHADVHPGNLFVLPDGSIGAVDFGIMGRVDLPTRRTLGELLLAFLSRDFHRAAEVHFEAGWVPAHQDVDAFTQACRSIAEPILDRPQNEISIGKLLGQLFEITETFQMEAQPQLLLLQKTMLVAEGTGRKLVPDANMWMLARPLVEEWMFANLGPEAKIKSAVEDLGKTIQRLPHLLDAIESGASMIKDGRLNLHPDTIRALRNGGHKSSIPPSTWLIIATLFALAAFLKWG